jgi:para-aminobenzoate synthetase component I
MNQHFHNFLEEKKSFVWLNGNNHSEGLIALGVKSECIIDSTYDAFIKFRVFQKKHKNEYVFGYLTYDLKNEIESLSSNNADIITVPALHFFVPESVISVSKNLSSITLISGLEEDVNFCNELIKYVKEPQLSEVFHSISLQPSISKDSYLTKVNQIKNHIQLGDVYELNFCYEFNGKGEINPLEVYKSLNQKSQASFSVFAKFNQHYVMSASPERFFNKVGNTISSQPIKGTIRRGKTNEEDQELKKQLQNDPKERRENIMIVDLVRNDLSKIATKGSVKVDELCEIYTFDTLHQMISTISCQLKPECDVVDVLESLFPMGSMTGAPKIRAMQLIEEYEETKRGLYSGSIGYFAPNGDADFNVVIRTLLYNSQTNQMSYSVGSAITNASIPEKEYEETLLKANLILNLIHPNTSNLI